MDNGLIIKINEYINIKETSGFRKSKVFIKGADFVPINSEFVPSSMSELLYQYNNNDLSLIENIADFHIRFEHIHPFEDGNESLGQNILAFSN